MKAELKSIHSPDIDIRNYWPENPESFHFLLQVMIGPEGEDSSESFDFEVFSPIWIQNNIRHDDMLYGLHKIILTTYDIPLLENRLRHLCSRTMGETWHEIAQKLSRYGRWEYEGYVHRK